MNAPWRNAIIANQLGGGVNSGSCNNAKKNENWMHCTKPTDNKIKQIGVKKI